MPTLLLSTKFNWVDVRSNQITNASIGSIALGCTRIETLSLTGTQVSDEGLKQLVTSCRNLKRVRVSLELDIVLFPLPDLPLSTVGHFVLQTDHSGWHQAPCLELPISP